jgi:hypothetical protein
MAITPGREKRHRSLPMDWVPISSDRLGAGEEFDIGVDYSDFAKGVNLTYGDVFLR